MYGYAGRILRVDLSDSGIREGELNEELVEKYVGGNGFGIKILYDEVGPGTDPLGLSNKIIFVTGPLCGTLLPIAVKFGAYARSPLTGILGESFSSGIFSEALKYAGYDVLIIEGRAKGPVYIEISDDRVEVKDAGRFWGRNCWEVEDAIRGEFGAKRVGTLTIGPAGENLVKFACVTVDRYRQLGRTGIGCIMGSKNLKAIAVHGTGKVGVANPDALKGLANETIKRSLGPEIEHHRVYGTMGTVEISSEQNAFPTRNWKSTSFEGAQEMGVEAMFEKTFVKDVGCVDRCPIACGKLNVVKDGPYKGATVVGPEYQTAYALGSNCGVDDIRAIVKANEVCDQLGIDTISGGCAVAFAMECYEKGLIGARDTGGLKLGFGDPEAVLRTLEMVARRERVGNVLAEGVRSASGELGCEDIAVQVKGLDCPGYDARTLKGTALQYAVSSRGACHLRARAQVPELRGVVDYTEVEGKGQLVKDREDLFTLFDSMIVCKFALPVFDLPEMARAYEFATGIEASVEELLLVGERITNLERLFNVREGIGREDDNLPRKITDSNQARFTDQAQLDRMLDDYYDARGWDRISGSPLKGKLAELGLQVG